MAYAECPLDVRESLAAQYFVDAIRDEDTQHSIRLMDAKDLKSPLVYSMKYEAARSVSKTSSTSDQLRRRIIRVEKEMINLNSSLTGWKNYYTVMLLERRTLLGETRTSFAGSATRRGTCSGSGRRLLRIRKTNKQLSCGAKAAFSE
ncbi:hypothetical protein AVEN_112758-1 [Araneus ventricosus]|uniref:Uncharacterized protein n=1 Tax=Araneus ventricosus TaxID=182803 RepID=A0A4Y2KAP6_ARAVE|nr:hypothetical protein AVEN_112758-1 [Araneus ventricosus]